MTEEVLKLVPESEEGVEEKIEENEPEKPKPRKKRKSLLRVRDLYGEAEFSMTGQQTLKDAAGPEPDRGK